MGIKIKKQMLEQAVNLINTFYKHGNNRADVAGHVSIQKREPSILEFRTKSALSALDVSFRHDQLVEGYNPVVVPIRDLSLAVSILGSDDLDITNDHESLVITGVCGESVQFELGAWESLEDQQDLVELSTDDKILETSLFSFANICNRMVRLLPNISKFDGVYFLEDKHTVFFYDVDRVVRIDNIPFYADKLLNIPARLIALVRETAILSSPSTQRNISFHLLDNDLIYFSMLESHISVRGYTIYRTQIPPIKEIEEAKLAKQHIVINRSQAIKDFTQLYKLVAKDDTPFVTMRYAEQNVGGDLEVVAAPFFSQSVISKKIRIEAFNSNPVPSKAFVNPKHIVDGLKVLDGEYVFMDLAGGVHDPVYLASGNILVLIARVAM